MKNRCKFLRLSDKLLTAKSTLYLQQKTLAAV